MSDVHWAIVLWGGMACAIHDGVAANVPFGLKPRQAAIGKTRNAEIEGRPRRPVDGSFLGLPISISRAAWQRREQILRFSRLIPLSVRVPH
jgi:hypothetical protein